MCIIKALLLIFSCSWLVVNLSIFFNCSISLSSSSSLNIVPSIILSNSLTSLFNELTSFDLFLLISSTFQFNL
ncbi:hypothetical protein PPACK8108_LOCUS13375 [Phakopsora pachyrhizi]|uniref:Secreted protein n=1 Tax=Phakopsora pachyrhizi TaxID=170000 RepID=A0AAV0B6H5_PHAPC|nr:hypothetical protein PPACK8108_LOCUS13375 [Phakopsora pachyrhizi]